MIADAQDWRGEHLIRCAPPPSEPDKRSEKTRRKIRRNKVALMIRAGRTAPEIAQRLGISDSIVYKDAVKLGLSLRRAKAA